MTGFDDKLAGLRARFLDRCRTDLPLLEAAAARPQAADAEELRFCVHRLAGAAGTFGFPDLSAAAGDADDELVQGRAPSPDQLRRVVELVKAELQT